jgi:hypothetical protein
MADTKVFSFPDNGGNNGGGLFGGSSGWGGGILGFLLGLMFGNGGWGGFGNWGGGNNGGAGFLSNQINNDNGRDLLMQAITSQGEQSRQAISTLSTMLGQDFNLVNSSIQTIGTAVNNIANAQGMNALQVINAIQSGNASLSSQLCQCCCNMQSTVNNGFGDVQRAIADKAAADQLGTCQQTYALTENANRNNQAILDKLASMETRALQDKLDAAREKNTQLSGEISQLNQKQYIAGVVGQSMAPLNAQLAALNKEVDDIKCKLPNTVNVEYPNLVAVNATPYVNGGFYGNSGYNYYGGNGFGGGIVF